MDVGLGRGFLYPSSGQSPDQQRRLAGGHSTARTSDCPLP